MPKFGFVLNDKVFSSIQNLRAMDNLFHPSSGTSMTSPMSHNTLPRPGEPARQASGTHLAWDRLFTLTSACGKQSSPQLSSLLKLGGTPGRLATS